MVAADKPGAELFTTTVSSKGQVVIPKAMRDRLGLHPGDILEAEEVDGALLLRVRRHDAAALKARLFGPPLPIEAVAGSLAHLARPGPAPSMKALRAIAQADFARRLREREAGQRRVEDDQDHQDDDA